MEEWLMFLHGTETMGYSFILAWSVEECFAFDHATARTPEAFLNIVWGITLQGRISVKKTNILKAIIIICLVILAGMGIAAGVYLKQQWDRTTYFENTTINGFHASEKTPQEMVGVLAEAYRRPVVHITENGEEAMSATLEELGYTVDEAALEKALEDALSKQKSSIPVLIASLMDGNAFQVTVSFAFDESVFQTAVVSTSLKEPRVSSIDAKMLFDEATKTYYIEPEINGTELEDASLQKLVKEQVDALVSGREPQEDLTIEIPSSIYLKPQVTQDDVEMNNRCNIYNQYDKAEITYLFGDTKEVLDWNTIQNWLTIVNGSAAFDETAIQAYVTELASKYNSIYYDRRFQTSLGTTVTIPGTENEYGYLVDEAGEYAQLMADIQANAAVEREPVYSYSGYKRDGADDLAGTYVEVNLTTQHIWFYVDGELIVESDIVSGCVSKKTETQTGAFPLAYKESPSVLEGNNAENGWRTEVTYWMPFFDGQGLHDATWRSSFGGTIYQNNGSHGCVNLPYATAQKIYDNIDAGVAIILYK